MPSDRDWRTPAAEAGNDALQYCDIAIGYLSRNPRYQADYRRALGRVKRGTASADDATATLVRRWGISFHAEPASAYDPRHAVMRPELSPSNIVLAPALPGFSWAQLLDVPALGQIRVRVSFDGFVHFILADPEGDEHLWVAGRLDQPLALMLPYGPGQRTHMSEAERLRRRLRGIATGPPALRIAPSRRIHLLTLLRLLDGRRAGASQRELAAVLIDNKVRTYSAADWTDSNERKRIRRWSAEALELMQRGYLRLLGGG
jgi:hypothetical protein